MSSNIVQKLRDYLDSKENAAFKRSFEAAFNTVKRYNLAVFAAEKIHTVAEYLNFYEKLLKWVPEENKDGTYVINNICIFYLVLDTDPLRWYQNPIDPSTRPKYFFLTQWIIEYAQEIGHWMDLPESISEKTLATFYEAPNYHMQDYDRPRDGWKSFNEFFARKIKPEVRKIDAPNDDHVIVSPADATFDGSWPISTTEDVEFQVKGVTWSIRQLLDDHSGSVKPDSDASFAGGRFCHSFLGPNDYHRLHAPVSGKVVEARAPIPGLCYLEVAVVDDNHKVVVLSGEHPDPKTVGASHLAIRRSMAPMTPVVADNVELSELGKRPDVPNTPGYQFIQARGLVVIDNPVLGRVAVLPIGMAQVSSVKLSVEKDQYVKKGDEIGYFQFGGSDIVMVFQAKANVTFTAKPTNHEYEEVDTDLSSAKWPPPGWLAFGQKIAQASPRKPE